MFDHQRSAMTVDEAYEKLRSLGAAAASLVAWLVNALPEDIAGHEGGTSRT